jgi:hypothetical protein
MTSSQMGDKIIFNDGPLDFKKRSQSLSRLPRLWRVHILRKLNPDKEARLHVDINATRLTQECVDELFQAGMTDVGIDLKAIDVETYYRLHVLKIEKDDDFIRTSHNKLFDSDSFWIFLMVVHLDILPGS